MNDFKYFDLMHRYARGKMTGAERSGFEKQLAENAGLAAEWAEYQLIAGAVEQHMDARKQIEAARDELRQDGFFDQLYSEIDREMAAESAGTETPARGKVVRMSAPLRWMSAAAAVLVLVVAGYFMFRQTPAPEIDLAAEIRRGMETTQRPQGYAPGDTLSLMQQLLREEKAKEALALAAAFSTVPSKEFQLEIGRAHLMVKQFPAALDALRPVLDDPDNSPWPTYCEARYLAALAYLELGQHAQCQRELDGIIADRDQYGQPSPRREDALGLKAKSN